jgi:ribosome modulation factor
MARAKAGHGHNSGDLTDEEKSALLHHHLIGIRQAQKAAAMVKATYDAKRDEVNKAFAACKGDLGFKRKDLEELLDALGQTEVAFRNNENARRARFALAGLPMGSQLDLFAADTVGDRDAARADGYRAGVRADDMEVPDHIDPLFRGDWEDGWRDGQAENARKLAIAMGVVEARSKPAEPEIIGDEEPDPEDVEEALDEAARKLKRGGFLNRSTETVGDEAPAAA